MYAAVTLDYFKAKQEPNKILNKEKRILRQLSINMRLRLRLTATSCFIASFPVALKSYEKKLFKRTYMLGTLGTAYGL